MTRSATAITATLLIYPPIELVGTNGWMLLDLLALGWISLSDEIVRDACVGAIYICGLCMSIEAASCDMTTAA